MACDPVSLSWCLPEIRATLARIEDTLERQLSLEAVDLSGLQQASRLLGQFSGVLGFIGVAGTEPVIREAQALLAACERGDPVFTPTIAGLLMNALQTFVDYLDELAAGRPDRPVRLFPVYEQLLQARKAGPANPADLFSPRLAALADAPLPPAPAADAPPIAAMRTAFEKGLLQAIREPASPIGPRLMRRAVSAVRASAPGLSDLGFWWVADAYFSGLHGGRVPLDATAKRLLARFNLHLRGTLESKPVAGERLLAEMLYAINLALPGDAAVDEVRFAFGLGEGVADAADLTPAGRIDARAMRQAREALGRARGALDRLSRGSLSDAPVLLEALDALHAPLDALPAVGLQALSRTLAQVRRVPGVEQGQMPDAVALEVATAILFLEQALEQGGRPDPAHDRRGIETSDRLSAALAGRDYPAALPGWMRELGRAAQERATTAAFVAEAQASLRVIEKTLDEALADPAAGHSLGECVAGLRQIAGALRLFGHDAVARGAGLVADQLGDFPPNASTSDTAPAAQQTADPAWRIASSLGALGFFIDSLGHGGQGGGRFWVDETTGELRADLSVPAAEPGGERPAAAASLPVQSSLAPPAQTPATALMPPAPGEVPTAEPVVMGDSEPQFDLLPVFAKAVEALPRIETPEQRLVPDVEAIEFDSSLIHAGLASGPDWLGPPAVREAPAEPATDPAAPDPLAALEQADWTLSSLAPAVSPDATRALPGPVRPSGRSASGLQQPPTAVPPPPAPVEPMATADDELIGIFLDEADEVLGTIAEQVACAESAPRDQAPLVALRRAFHTLKGSSRMVGLEAFGAAAWAMEELFNHRFALGSSPGDPDLFDLVGRAHGAMIGWVAALRTGQRPAIDPEPLARAAQALREGRPLPPPEIEAAPVPAAMLDEPVAVQPDEPASALPDAADAVLLDEPDAVLLDEPDAVLVDEPDAVLAGEPDAVLAGEPDAVLADEPQTAPDTVRIGDRELSRPLYLIFLSEADELITALRADVEDWQAQPGRDVSADALRAAHSLSGGAAVMQLDTVHRLAQALELAYHRQSQSRRAVAPDELTRVAAAIDRIHGMLHRFAGGDWPMEDPALLADLDELAERWAGEPAPEPLPLLDDPDASEVIAAEPVEPPPADEIDPELLPIFLEEAADDLPRIGESLRAWAAAPQDASLPQALMRVLHTVKGSARMAGAMHLGQLLHDAETRVDELAVLAVPDPARIEELIAHTDKAMALFDALRRPTAASLPTAPAPAEPVSTQAAAGAAPLADPRAATDDATVASPQADRATGGAPSGGGEQALSAAALPPLAPAAPALPASVPAAPAPLVRVRADLLDRLVNEAGEVSISRSRLDNELSVLRQSLLELTENVGRLRAQLREIEIQADTQIQARIAQQKDHERTFDPLEFDRYTRFQELTRMLAESVNDVATVQGHALRSLDGAGQDLHRQGQVLRDLQQDLMRARMVQFGSIADRLYRVVRRAAKETDKRVNLDIRGATVEVDRGVLERMAGPIEHLLRNSVAHGIELPATRQARGKPETGEIRVEVRQEGREIVLAFADDGGGLDLARIRQRALAQSLIAEDARLSDRELADLIFVQGFSTAASVTELSGRGVGMDVVRAEVASLGGRIETETETGRGTRFTVHLPLTLAVSQVLLLSAGRARFAVPSSSVEQVLQLKPQALADAYAQRSLLWQEQVVPLFYLGGLAGLPELVPLAQHLSPVVIIRAGHQRIAVHADEVTRNQEVVVKSVGAQAARVPGLTGATVLGNGDIVLIVNLVVLAKLAAGESLERSLPAPAIEAVMPEALPPLVMVVDDSLTVRKVTQRLLSREGYQVLLARDGVDALRQLEEVVPDAMLLDIEMPRMDGFELLRHLRADARLARIPIVMITSRTADKHRNHALELGVDAYLGKPYPEDELLALLARFTRPVPRQANSG